MRHTKGILRGSEKYRFMKVKNSVGDTSLTEIFGVLQMRVGYLS